jgi:hypothetical protein
MVKKYQVLFPLRKIRSNDKKSDLKVFSIRTGNKYLFGGVIPMSTAPHHKDISG